MLIPDKLKCNKFANVAIPSNKDYFSRFGARNLPDSAFSGDESSPVPGRKIDNLAYMDDYDRMMQEKESKSE